MKFSTSGIRVLRDFPSDAEVISHKWLVRGGYLVQHASGIYSFAPLFYRTYRKISRIVEEEIDRSGACQVQLPLLQSGDIWRRSGRWRVYQESNLLFHLEDRKGSDYGLCPTAEEVVTEMAKQLINSPKQLPVNFYQQHTKFRDELRPAFRHGALPRVHHDGRLFSFDIDEAGLDVSYRAMDARLPPDLSSAVRPGVRRGRKRTPAPSAAIGFRRVHGGLRYRRGHAS